MEWTKGFLLVAAGGAVGSVLRYAAGLWRGPEGFPWSTLLVNVAGCLLIGVFWGLAQRFTWMGSEGRLLLMTGFCGGLTTFSAFALENVRLLHSGNYRSFFLYTGASLLLSLAAVTLGFTVFRK